MHREHRTSACGRVLMRLEINASRGPNWDEDPKLLSVRPVIDEAQARTRLPREVGDASVSSAWAL